MIFILTSSKTRGTKPKFDHEKIKELIKAGEKPVKIMILLGCSYGVVRYVRERMKKRVKP